MSPFNSIPKFGVITQKTIDTIAVSSICFVFITLVVAVVDVNLKNKDNILLVDPSVSPWFGLSITFFLVSVLMIILLYKVGAKRSSGWLYLIAVIILSFVFCVIQCSGGLYSPFLSLYALVFAGAIIISESRYAIIFMMAVIIGCISYHWRNIPYVKEAVLNHDVYRLKFYVVSVAVFLVMMIAEWINAKNSAD